MIQTQVWNGGVDFAPSGGKKRRTLNFVNKTMRLFGVVGFLNTCIAAKGMEEVIRQGTPKTSVKMTRGAHFQVVNMMKIIRPKR